MVTIFAGDTFEWEYTNASYDAGDSWVLTLSLVSASKRYTSVAAGVGTVHTFTIADSVTATFLADSYQYYITANDGAESVTVEIGPAVVKPDPRVGTFDTRLFAQKMLDAIEATLLGDATDEQLQYLAVRHGDMNLQQDYELLQRLRQQYKAEAQAQNAQAAIRDGMANPYRLRIRNTIV